MPLIYVCFIYAFQASLLVYAWTLIIESEWWNHDKKNGLAAVLKRQKNGEPVQFVAAAEKQRNAAILEGVALSRLIYFLEVK